MLLIKNLAGIYTGKGFKKNQGRKPAFADCDYTNGPVDILIDPSTEKIISINKQIPAEPNYKVFTGEGLFATSGFIDSHTHLTFKGNRANEFFLKWQGKGYVEISKSGGGIKYTFSQTKLATDDELISDCKSKIQEIIKTGTTHLEIKSGYGLCPKEELRLLKIAKKLKQEYFSNLSITFLALHAIPEDSNEVDFVNSMIKILPEVKKLNIVDFVDCFPEEGFFSTSECIRFSKEAQKLGFKIKTHCDEISNNLKSSEEFIDIKATSIDHLEEISDQAIEKLQNSVTVANILPATSFYLNLKYAPARKLIDNNAIVSIATDYNPGTAPNFSLRFSQLLAASKLKMSAAEILAATTFNAAQAINMDEEIGLVEVNYKANLCLWKCDSKEPQKVLQEIMISNQNPEFTFINGELIQG